ncbi:MAG: sensor histidine kinase [Rhodococcus sp.]|uniref:sensor histidine kinase n=1 Tax=Rhodococcus sp. TaxID=1831 RepID=UPI00169618CA|nr:sensor histidine kinase [Rhodococcus sp. (in: high G+C Gram-positive bacteria)]NLV80912.1 sensor histidine kinase [Rhodococcus sp. (in: high G+C Gram-positive bacteria)]
MASRTPFERWHRWSRTHVPAVDAVWAGLLTAFGLAVTVGSGGSGVDAGFVLGLCVPLAWRRTRPVVAGAVVAAVAFVHLAVLPEMSPVAPFAVPTAIYALAAYAPRRVAVGALALAMIGGALAGVRYFGDYEGRTRTDMVVSATTVGLFVAGVWAFGRMRGLRVREVEALTERNRLLEVERVKEAELAATQERTRIAREMHDIVAHSLTAIIAQADGGRYAATSDPSAAVGALSTISDTGRRALTDMRSLLSVLRDDDRREFTTTPGVREIGVLVDRMRASGLDVTYTVTGDPREITAGPGLSVYRIVQESLTNVLKHAGPRALAAVTLTWRPDTVTVEVVDDGRGAAALVESRPGGQGLTGIEERARLHGGRALTGPRPGGGFRVRAEIPVEAPRSPSKHRDPGQAT